MRDVKLKSTHLFAFVFLGLFNFSSVTHSQSGLPRLVRDVEFTREFLSIVGARELPDGSVLVGDRMAREVVLLSASLLDGRVIVSEGSGPAELKTVSAVTALPGDTTLLYDSVLRRALVMVGPRVRQTVAVESFPWRGSFLFPLAANGRGGLYGQRSKESAIRKGPINPDRLSPLAADTAELVMFSEKQSMPTVLFTQRGGFTPSTMVVRTIAGVTSYHQLVALLVRSDLLAVCQDARVLHASPTEGTVQWWNGGRFTPVSLGTISRMPVTDPLKRRAVTDFVGADNAKYFKPSEFPAWPKYMPLFERDGARCLASGSALLEGSANERGERQYWLIGPSGPARTVEGAPGNAKLVGAGAIHVYFAFEEDDGTVRLSRYRVQQ